MGKINNENTLEARIKKNIKEICFRVDPEELIINIQHKLRNYHLVKFKSIVEKNNRVDAVFKIYIDIQIYCDWCKIFVDALRKCADTDLLILIGVEQAKTEEDKSPPHNQNRTTHTATSSLSSNLQRVGASSARGSSNNCPGFQTESYFLSENILSPAETTHIESRLPLSTNIPCNSLSGCPAGNEVIANESTISSDQNETDGLGSWEYNKGLQEDCGSHPGTVSTFGDDIQVLNPSLQSLDSSSYCSFVSHGGARKKEAKCMYTTPVNFGTSARCKLCPVLTKNSCSRNAQTTGHCSEEAVDDRHHLFMEVDSEELSCDAEPSFSGYQQNSIPQGARGLGFASDIGVPSIPNGPMVSSSMGVPSIPNGPMVSSGMGVPSTPNGPMVLSGMDVPSIPNGPVVSSSMGVPNILNGPIVSSGMGVPSIPNSQMVSSGTGVPSVLFGTHSLNRPRGRSPSGVPDNLHSPQPFLSQGSYFADPDFDSTSTMAENSTNNTHNYYFNISLNGQAGPSILMVGNNNFVTADPSKDVTVSHINSHGTDDSFLMHSSLEGIPSPAETSHETGRKVLRGAAATDLATIHGLNSMQLKVPHEKNTNVHRGRKKPSAVRYVCSQQERSAELGPSCTLDSHETNLKQGAQDHTLWRSGDIVPRTLGVSRGLDVSPDSFTFNRVDHETSLKRTVGDYQMSPGENYCDSLDPLSVTNADHETNLKQIADSRSMSTAVNAVVSTPVQVEESNLGIGDISLNQVCQAVNDPLNASDLVAE